MLTSAPPGIIKSNRTQKRMNWIDKIKNLWKPDEMDELSTPQQEQSVFTLKYKKLEIGILSIKDGKWMFRYSDEFKKQNQLPLLVDFQNVDKEYQSKELWPFFASRIPSANLPTVQETAHERNIDVHNEVQMLKEFGRRTITNPFLLTPEEV